jgi:predicted ABC-type ATPase
MKLFTKEIDKKLFAQYSKGSDLSNQMVVAKIFNPYGRGTWYLINSDEDDPDYLWAIVDLFEVEVGSVSRKELESIKIKPFNFGLERDLSFRPKNAEEVFKGLLSGKTYARGGITARGLGKINDKVFDKHDFQSGSEIKSSKANKAKYAQAADDFLKQAGVEKGSLTKAMQLKLEDENLHTLNEFLVLNDYYQPGVSDKQFYLEAAEEQPNFYLGADGIIGGKSMAAKTTSKSSKLKYNPSRDVVAIAIKDGPFTMMFTKGDFLGGAYQMEKGGSLENYLYVSPRKIIFARLKSGEDIKPINGFYIRKDASGTLITGDESKPRKKANLKSLKISIPRPILLTGSPSKSPKMMKFIGTFSGKDSIRPAMSFVQVKEGSIVATDANKLIRIIDGSTLNEDKLVCESRVCKDNNPEDQKFPNWTPIVNSFDSQFSESYDMVDLYEALMQVRNDDLKNKVSKTLRVIELKLENVTIYFNITLLLQCVKGCLLLGWKKAFISYSSAEYKAVVFTEENVQGRLSSVSLIMLMPIFGSDDFEKVTITPKVLLEQGGMMGEGAETMIQPTILQNNPNALVGTNTMYEMFADGGVIPYTKNFLKGMQSIKVNGLGGYMPGVRNIYWDKKDEKFYVKDFTGDWIFEIRNGTTLKEIDSLLKKSKIELERMADGGAIDDDEGVDLFDDYEDQPAEVQAILAKYELEDNDYNTLKDLQAELEGIGYTFEFGLDAEPFDLREIGQKGKSEFYAKGGEIKSPYIVTFGFQEDGEYAIKKSKPIFAENENAAAIMLKDQFEAYEGLSCDIINVKKMADGGMMSKGGALEHMILLGDKVIDIYKNVLIVESAYGGVTVLDFRQEPIARRILVERITGKNTLASAKEFIDADPSFKTQSMAVGGSLQGHGFEVGDRIAEDLGGYIRVVSEDGKDYFIKLRDGDRLTEPPLPFKDGGKVKTNDLDNKTKFQDIWQEKNKEGFILKVGNTELKSNGPGGLHYIYKNGSYWGRFTLDGNVWFVEPDDGKDFFVEYIDLIIKRVKADSRTNQEGDEDVDLTEFYEGGGKVPKVFDVPAQFLDAEGKRKNDRKTIKELTDFVLALPQTKEIYYNDELGDYTPSRKKLHAEIINKFKKEVVCINNDQPIAIFMGGSPASGKSSFLRKYSPFLLKEEILKIDADEIRAMLPEYEGWNACQTHLETKDIVNILLSNKNIGIPCDFDIIYDGTMNSVKSYIPLMDILRKRGYKIFIVFMDNVPKDVIIKRALDRYKTSGRFVPLEVIEDFFSKGKTAFNELKKDVDGYMLIDGSSQDYKVIEEGGIKLPRDREYSKLGTKIKASEIPVSYKKGGLGLLY